MKNQPYTIVRAESSIGDLERENATPKIELGQWYWLKEKNHNGEEVTYFVCVVHIGSNYLKLETPRSHKSSYSSWRVHFDNYDTLVYEPNAEQVLAGNVVKYQQAGNQALTKIKELTMRLGLNTGDAINKKDRSGTGLAVMSNAHNIEDYKTDLIKAENETLPDLFRQVQEAHGEMARWMSAGAIKLQTAMKGMEESLSGIKDRILNVSLYAGLEEHIKQCLGGNPANILEKLHIMQSKLYMDEECLLNYTAGGMEFKDISEFDDWICLPENRDRILPFQRTAVAMQVRRNNKDRSDDDLDYFIKMRLESRDKYTYLYLRNGEQVWRLSLLHFEFDEVLFPDRSVYDPSEPKMMRISCGRIEKFMSVREYEYMQSKYIEFSAKYDSWAEKNPTQDPRCNPFRIGKEINGLSGDWQSFNETSVYYDDAVEKIILEIKKYNRISLIVQGIFDRSPVFAPHLPVQTWNPQGFNKAIVLVYDNENILYAGSKPDFIAYRNSCNAQITKDSILTGQLVYWMRQEAEKENKRLYSHYRYGSRNHHYNLFKPHGNDGMGFVCKADNITKSKATFKWLRSKYGEPEDTPSISCQITVPLCELFNISAYKKGDYKQFFSDPRTRQEYLKWAPFLLAAEDYLGDKIKCPDDFNSKFK